MAMNLSTEALARAAGRRPWITIGVWVAALVAALVLTGTLLVDALGIEQYATNTPESRRAYHLLEERLGSPADTIDEMVIVRSTTFTVDDPEYQGFVEGLFGDLTSLSSDVIVSGTHYYLTGNESMVSADRRTTLMPLAVPGDIEKEIKKVHQVVNQANGGGPFQVLITGEATLWADMFELAQSDLVTGESIGIPVALVILVLVFGAIGAALLPVVLAIVAIVLALGAAALVGQAFDLHLMVTNMITMIGLAVGIDYSLFIVSRYQEERGRGREKLDAIAAAGATASRTVLFSGMTVVLALSGLLIVPFNGFIGLGAGAILVVIAAVLASLTLLPAILGLLGDRVNAIRIPLIQRRQAGHPAKAGGGLWDWTSRAVMRHPLVSLVVAGGLLIAAATPYLDINTGMSGVDALPDGLRSKDGFIVLEQEFGFGMDAPALVVIDGQTDSESVQAAMERLEEFVASDSVFSSSRLEVYPEADLAVFSARLAGDPWEKEAMDAVSGLRSDFIPEAFDGVPAEVLVTGLTAEWVDIIHNIDTYTPAIFAFILGLSFVLLTVMFRSIVVPLTSIVMNLLSVGTAYGLLVLVFLKGVGAGLLGFQQVTAIDGWIPLFLFAVLFGLSMDYHLFLLSRIRERFDQTHDNRESVAFGLRSTGRLITGAALIMVAVFGGFAMGDFVAFQQLGFGLAVAVLLDATIVRSVLVPATMRLLGGANWYLPSWLGWLPRVSPTE